MKMTGIKDFIYNIWLDIKGYDIVFKSPPEDAVGRYNEKQEYWQNVVAVCGGAAILVALTLPSLVGVAALVGLGIIAAAKLRLILTKEPPKDVVPSEQNNPGALTLLASTVEGQKASKANKKAPAAKKKTGAKRVKVGDTRSNS